MYDTLLHPSGHIVSKTMKRNKLQQKIVLYLGHTVTFAAALHRLTDQRLSVTDAIRDTDYPTSIMYTTDDLRRNDTYNSEPVMENHQDSHSPTIPVLV